MGSKILVADDSITIQKVIGLTFANEDFELVSADNGDEALEKALANLPHLVIADTNMPGLSGYDLCERIRAESTLATIPVVLLTGTYEVFDEDRAKAVGANDHLTKPFESQVLIDKVKNLLAQAAAPSAAPTDSPAAAATELEPEPEMIEEIEDIDAFDGGLEPLEEEPAAIEEITEPEPEASQPEVAETLDFSDVSVKEEEVVEAEPAPVAAAPQETQEDTAAASDNWDMDDFEDYLGSQDQDTEIATSDQVDEPQAASSEQAEEIEFDDSGFDDAFMDTDDAAAEPEIAMHSEPTEPDAEGFTENGADVDVFAEFEQFEASQQQDEVTDPEPDVATIEDLAGVEEFADVEKVGEAEEIQADAIEPEAPEASSVDLSDDDSGLEITESAAEEANRPDLAKDYSSHYEQTFDSQVEFESESLEDTQQSEPVDTEKVSVTTQQETPPDPTVDPEALQAQIRESVDASLKNALDSTVQQQIESAVNDAVEKAVAQVMDELRRRLS